MTEPTASAPAPTALIAEDEPLLAAALQAELARAWPELRVLASVGDGRSALQQALALQPDVLFLDIRMPGLSGLQAAADLADAWPLAAAGPGKPFPQLVFVTAYDHYAVQAFEAQAVDYLVKPVPPARLQKTVAKLRLALAGRASGAINSEAVLEAALAQLRQLLGNGDAATAKPAAAPAARLSVIQASVSSAAGSHLQLVPIEQVLYFEAADKYLRVVCARSEVLIRTALKDLLPQLDPDLFWQIHRSTVVRASAIERVSRDEAGRQWLHLRGRSERLGVSRLYSGLFKAM